MRVYVKKEDKNSMIPGIIIAIIFLSFAIGIIVTAITSGKSFIDILASFVITLMFTGFGMYFVYALFKSPQSYKATLVKKKVETFNGKQITYMKFKTEKEKNLEEDSIPKVYNCYTIGENNLVKGKDYSLKIKEFNWEPKYIEEINDSYATEKNEVKSKVPSMTLFPAFLAIELLFAGNLFFCILGIIMYPEYTSTYIMFGTFCAIALFLAYKYSQTWKNDNNLEKDNTYLDFELNNIKPIDDNQEKIGNLAIKHLLILLVLFPVFWAIILLTTNIPKETFIIAFSMILFVELPVIIMILYNIGFDERMIKKYKINISENLNIPNIKYFNIIKPNQNTTFPHFYIVDQNKNLIFKIKKGNFIGNKFVICNPDNIKIGEIESKILSLTDEFIVNIINENPFIIRSKMQVHSNYQIIGRDYYVKGDTHLIRNIIYDTKKNDIAYISAISKNSNNKYELGNMEITLNDNVNNSLDIMIIALCITIGNLNAFKRRTTK